MDSKAYQIFKPNLSLDTFHLQTTSSSQVGIIMSTAVLGTPHGSLGDDRLPQDTRTCLLNGSVTRDGSGSPTIACPSLLTMGLTVHVWQVLQRDTSIRDRDRD